MEFACYLNGCSQHPSLVCHCNESSTFSCLQHYGLHVAQNPGLTHIPNSLEIDVKESDKSNFIEYLERLLEKEKKIKAQVLNLVNQIIQESQKIIFESNKNFTKIKQMIHSIRAKGTVFCIPEKELKQSKSFFDFEKLQKFEVTSEEYRTKTWKYFKFDDCLVSFLSNNNLVESIDICNNNLYCFLHRTNILIGLNLNDLSETRKKIDSFNDGLLGSCILQFDKDKLFIHGGRINSSSYSSSTIFVDLRTMNIEKMPDGIPKSHSKPILKNNKIYIFGGSSYQSKIKTSQVFDLKLKVWKGISDLPIPSTDISSILLYNDILLSSGKRDCLHLYNISNNSFQKIPIGKEISFRNILLKYKEEIFLITEQIFESTLANVNKWTKISDNGLNEGNVITAGILKNENFYFADWKGNIYKFDCNTKIVQIVKILV